MFCQEYVLIIYILIMISAGYMFYISTSHLACQSWKKPFAFASCGIHRRDRRGLLTCGAHPEQEEEAEEASGMHLG